MLKRTTCFQDEEYAPQAPDEMMEAENWVHQRKHMLKQGRLSKWVNPDAGGDEGDEGDEAGEAEEEEEDEALPLLSGADGDAVKGLARAWTFRVCPLARSEHSLAMARSVVWPGAINIMKKQTVASVYIGWGQKNLGDDYTPPPPPQIQAEFVPVFNAEEGEENPLQEQVDPQPPKPEGGKAAKKDGEYDDDEDEESEASADEGGD